MFHKLMLNVAFSSVALGGNLLAGKKKNNSHIGAPPGLSRTVSQSRISPDFKFYMQQMKLENDIIELGRLSPATVPGPHKEFYTSQKEQCQAMNVAILTLRDKIFSSHMDEYDKEQSLGHMEELFRQVKSIEDSAKQKISMYNNPFMALADSALGAGN